ncbi:MAG TPA: hypothetical protein VG713_01440 [Pirellulales bacterium]|nr:hypothetical protein [Pirellulales bacterium]
MALRPSDREDLLAEAVALVKRIELRLPSGETVVVGFRRGGELSIYFGADPVFQFDGQQRLRRAFVGGQLLKAQGGRLVQVERTREHGRLVLVSQPLSAAQSAPLLASAADRLGQLRAHLSHGQPTIMGQVPPTGDLLAEIVDWLRTLPDPPMLADRPGIR